MIIYNKYIPFKGYSAMNIFCLIFARKEYKPLSKVTINHEQIHTMQIKECLFIGFYILYGLFWLINIIKYKHSKLAYYYIPFEIESYANQYNLDYHLYRKHYAWISNNS